MSPPHTGNQGDQDPPAALVDVVEPPHADREAGNERGQAINAAKAADDDGERFLPGKERRQNACVEHHAGDGVEEDEHPVLFTPGAAAKLRVFPPDHQIPIHADSLFQSLG